MDPRVGKTLDARYVVGQRIGEGGMGAVYEGEHVGLDRKIAIKFLAHHGLSSTERERFRREARLASRVVHENVSQVYDIGAHEGDDYIVMEYVEGRDLGRVIREEGPLAVGRTIQIARDVLVGLHAVHAEGIVHRDVKPTNVMLTMRGGRECVKIVDFGIARAIDERTLTVAGYVVGTAEFMAPEQIRGGEIDHRADLYAVGITLYAMLTSELPFTGATATVGAMQVFEPPPSLESKRAGLPPLLVAAVERALAKSPHDRFDDALQFSAALDREPGPASAEPTTRSAPTVGVRPPRKAPAPAPPRRRTWWLVVGATIMVAGLIGVLVARRASSPPTTRAVDSTVRPDPVVPSVRVTAPDAQTIAVATQDARVEETTDAAIVARPPSQPRIASGQPAASGRCRCIPARENIGLCPRQGPPLCRCVDSAKDSLCSAPYNWRCADLQWEDYAKPGAHGAPCVGYRWSESIAGVQVCDSCPNAKTQAYRGVEGAPCTGFWWRTGEPLEGTLQHCEY